MASRRTLARTAEAGGVTLHGGRMAAVSVLPAPSGSGIRFRLPSGLFVPADHRLVERVPLCTRLVLDGERVDTIEHLMAAFAILGITDAEVAVDGSELPILDGSAQPWLDAIEAAGVRSLSGAADGLTVVRPFSFRHGASKFEARPGPAVVEVTIDFAHPAVGRQTVVAERTGWRGLADSRTFAFLREVEAMRAAGLALGGSLENAVVVGDTGVLNPEGLRHADEFARHKALDLVGDLWMAGRPVLGRISALRPGHAANNAFLAALVDSGAALPSPEAAAALTEAA